IAYLNDASRAEGRESQVWHFLAIAYGRDNQIGMAALSLAEQALSDGKKKDAIQQANRAKHLLARNTASYARAEDIHRQAENLDKYPLPSKPNGFSPDHALSVLPVAETGRPDFAAPARLDARAVARDRALRAAAEPRASCRFHPRSAQGDRGDHPGLSGEEP